MFGRNANSFCYEQARFGRTYSYFWLCVVLMRQTGRDRGKCDKISVSIWNQQLHRDPTVSNELFRLSGQVLFLYEGFFYNSFN